MKKIISTLAMFALAASLAAPVFAATGANGTKGQTAAQTSAAKPTIKRVKAATKPASKARKSTKAARKSASKSAKSTTLQSK